MPDTQKPSGAKDKVPGEGEIQGEGDYVAGRRFQDAERSFAEKGPVERQAREAAAALDGPEAAELEAARIETGEGKIHPHPPAHKAGDASDAQAEKKLDRTLDDTFPASDPASASPGAD